MVQLLRWRPISIQARADDNVDGPCTEIIWVLPEATDKVLFDAFIKAYPRPPKRTIGRGNGVVDGYRTTPQRNIAAFDKLPKKMRHLLRHTVTAIAAETVNTGGQVS